MNKDTLRQTANLLSVLLALIVNILATTLPLNNQTTGQISDRFKVFFVPAGYVFAIWGIIYIGWIAFTVYQFLPAHKESPRLRGLGYSFALTGVFNAAWLFCWQYNHFTLSVIVMLILLGLLIASYLKLNVGHTSVSSAEKWCVDIPLSVYLGWISVATIANISDWLYFIHWDGFGIAPQAWAVIMLTVANSPWIMGDAHTSGQRLPVRVCLGFRGNRRQTSRRAFGSLFRLGGWIDRIRPGNLYHSSTTAYASVISYSMTIEIHFCKQAIKSLTAPCGCDFVIANNGSDAIL